MDRLQLYISKSLRGFKTLVNINGTEMVRRHLRDLRPALETVAYDSNEKCVFYLIQYIDGATVVSVLRTIPDQPLDHLSASLAIPNGLKITANEIYDILRTITRKVSNQGMSSDDVAQLRQMLTTTYAVDDSQAARVPSEGRTFAARFFNGKTGLKLIDFLGDKLYQPDDTAYAGVLLVDGDLPFEIKNHDISYQPLTEVVTLLPPKQVPDFTPYIFNRVFDKPYQVSLGSTVDIAWRRPGFEEVLQQVTVVADRMQPEAPVTTETRKTISRSTFYITSQTSNDQLPDCSIKVNGRELTDQQSFTQSELANAEVEVSTPGFQTYHGHLDLASTSQALIELIAEGKGKSKHKAASIDDTTTRIRESHSHQSRPHTRATMPLWQKLLFVLIGIIVALGICYLLMPELFGGIAGDKSGNTADSVPANSIAAGRMHSDSDSSAAGEPAVVAGETVETKQSQAAGETATTTTTAQAPADTQAATSDAESAAKYLDSNKYWKESEVASNPLLKAYYDDLLNFNLSALANQWPKKLPGSEWVKTVAQHAGDAMRKKLDPKAEGNTYRRSGRGQIHRQEYINWVNRRQE